MEDRQLRTPVALFVFNRPETTRRVLDAVRSAEPRRLFVVADGPREGYGEDEVRCAEAREVATDIDWDCEVHTNFADENMGLFRRFTTGLDWVFDAVDRAIILEDDCLPSQSFFRFCGALLDRYADDERVMTISGTNELGEWKNDRQDYHFARYESIWGWATWRRAWEYYDPEMGLWRNEEARERLADAIADHEQCKWRMRLYEETYSGDIDSWAFRWSFMTTIQSGLAAIPSKNLVTNIGFGEEATNLTDESSARSAIRRGKLKLPLDEPPCISADRGFDDRIYRRRTESLERIMYRYTPIEFHQKLSLLVKGDTSCSEQEITTVRDLLRVINRKF